MSNEEEPTNLEWVQLRQEIAARHPTETMRDKVSRKFNANPFVPIGCLATVAALTYGLWCFQTSNSKMSNKMMRYRIIAQGFTVAAIISGVIMSATKSPDNKFQD